MSRRADLPIALAVWLLGFAWVARSGSWAPLAIAAAGAALRLVVADPETRRLLVPRPAALAVGAAGAAAMTAATYLAFAAAARAAPGLSGATARLYGLLNADGYSPPVLLALVLLVVASEEIVWRGRLLASRAGAGAAWLRWLAAPLPTAIAYGAAHATSGSPLLVVVAFACGWSWALLRVAGGSLWSSLVAHALWDAAVLFAWPLVDAGS